MESSKGLLWFGAARVVVVRATWKGKVLDIELIRYKGLGSSNSILARFGYVLFKSKAIGGVFSRSSELAQSCVDFGWCCGLSLPGQGVL